MGMFKISKQNCGYMLESLDHYFHHPIAPWPLRCSVMMYNVIIFAQLIEINKPLRTVIGNNVFRNTKPNTIHAFNHLTLLVGFYYFYYVKNNTCSPMLMSFLF